MNNEIGVGEDWRREGVERCGPGVGEDWSREGEERFGVGVGED